MGWRDTIKPAGSSASWRDTIKPVESNPDDVPYAASAAAGFEDAIPFSHQIGAAGKTAMDVLSGAQPLSGAMDEYRSERDKLKQDMGQTASANPKMATLGGLATAPMMPIKSPAVYGGAMGLSNSDADLTKGELGKAVGDTAFGAATGQIAGDAIDQAGKMLSPASKKVADFLRAKAEALKVKATGATRAQVENYAPGTGRYLLDNKIGGAFSDPEAIANSAAAKLDASGKGIGESLKSLDEQGVTVDRHNVIAKLKEKLASLAGNEGEKPLASQLKQKIADIEEQIPAPTQEHVGYRPSGPAEEIVPAKYENDAYLNDPLAKKPARYVAHSPEDQWAKLRGEEIQPAVKSTPIEPKYGEVPGDSTIPVGKSEEIKRAFDKNGKWSSNSDAATLEANRTAANAYRGESERAATAANPELGEKFLADKKAYSVLSPVEEAARKRALQLQQSPHGGLLDIAAGGSGGAIGAAIGGPVGAAVGAGVGLGVKALRPRYASMGAHGSDALANLVAAAPESFGKYANVLKQAAARGMGALKATDDALRKNNPEYSKIVDAAQAKKAEDDAKIAAIPEAPEMVFIRDPKGNVRSIPASKKDAALKAGGKLVQ